jgi:hypothetical protein
MFVFIKRAYQSTNTIEVSADQGKQPADLAQNRGYFAERKLVSSKKIEKPVKD